MIDLVSVLALSAIATLITLCLLPSRRKQGCGDIHKALAAAVEREDGRRKTTQEQERELQQEIARRLAAAGIIFIYMRLDISE